MNKDITNEDKLRELVAAARACVNATRSIDKTEEERWALFTAFEACLIECETLLGHLDLSTNSGSSSK